MLDTSPPSEAISRTVVEERCDPHVTQKAIVSIAG